ncbi:hypothetical protein [Methanobacterium sp. BAmetb5]|uniref:hypothetical protein n=1 Tax=Methanobacterium sp. BAmetb5 TaxID=2025351 RepID=UPI000E98C63C|nr:hypothetical protein [Methanobacterium sp. BAmetb5]AXV39991.1 MAG: hypothetical protein CIT02_06530 [Methanobacterium sp. BAmetb5]
MKRFSKFNWLIDCVLGKDTLSVKYKVLLLTQDEYENFQLGQRAFLKLINFFVDNLDFLREIFEDPQEIINLYSQQYEKQIQDHEIEYDGLLTLTELRHTDGACVKLDQLDNTDGLIPFWVIKEICPIYYNILVMIEEVDFVIVLPEYKFAEHKKSRKKEIITHEALHIVEHLKGFQEHSFQIDSKVIGVLNKCLHRKYAILCFFEGFD